MKLLANNFGDKLRKHLYTFWFINTVGWTVYTAFQYFSMEIILNYHLKVKHTLMVYSVGYLAANLLHYIFRKLKRRSAFSASRIGYSISLWVLIISALWWFITRILSVLVLPLPSLVNIKTLGELFSSKLVSYHIYGVFEALAELSIWSGIYLIVDYWHKWKKQFENTEKEVLLAQNSHLQLLQYQINPHFLFNALNSIRALINENKKDAKEMVTMLSEYLRYSLITKDYTDVPLSAEIDTVKYYLAIERRRFENRLEVSFDVDPASCNYPVISFLIDPLIEHIIKYGFHASGAPLKINLTARIINTGLSLQISSYGQWGDLVLLKGINFYRGLKNIRQRLEIAYPDCHSFEIKESKNSVIITLIIYVTKRSHYEKVF